MSVALALGLLLFGVGMTLGATAGFTQPVYDTSGLGFLLSWCGIAVALGAKLA